jgi:hypothetical protein
LVKTPEIGRRPLLLAANGLPKREHGPAHLRCVCMRFDRSSCAAAALILLLGVTLPCAAQNAPVPNTPTPQTRDQKACVEDQRSPDDQSLSTRLQRTDGVICPPEIDPDIKAPTPQGGKMLVIPPPGSPGRDPTVRPK